MDNSLNFFGLLSRRRSPTELKQLRARLYLSAEQDLPLEELERLVDLDTEPQRADYKAVLKRAPHLERNLNEWIAARLSKSQLVDWSSKSFSEMLEEMPGRMADSQFRSAQLRNQLANGSGTKSNQTDEQETKIATVLLDDYELPSCKTSFTGKEIVEAATCYACAFGLERGFKRSRIMEQLASFDERKHGDRRNQTYNLSREEVIEFLESIFQR